MHVISAEVHAVVSICEWAAYTKANYIPKLPGLILGTIIRAMPAPHLSQYLNFPTVASCGTVGDKHSFLIFPVIWCPWFISRMGEIQLTYLFKLYIGLL